MILYGTTKSNLFTKLKTAFGEANVTPQKIAFPVIPPRVLEQTYADCEASEATRFITPFDPPADLFEIETGWRRKSTTDVLVFIYYVTVSLAVDDKDSIVYISEEQMPEE